MTQTTQMTQTTHEWITRLADDERKRDAVRSGEVEASARKAALVLRHGRALVDGLRAAVADDIAAFRAQFPGDAARDVTIAAAGAEGGFAVRKPGYPVVTLNVAPRWAAASVDCQYRLSTPDGLPAREDRFSLVFVPRGDDAQFKHLESGLLFADADALSEYLLTPVFTGRTR